MSNNVLVLVAAAGLAVAGYAAAASEGLLPANVDLGLGATKRCERADANAEGLAEGCEAARQQHGRGPKEGRGPMRHGPEGPRGPGPEGPKAPPFRVADGTVEGQWVSFSVDEATASLLDYTSRGPFADVVVFDRVTLGADSEDDGMRARGPLWVGKEGQVAAAAFNAPNAFLGVRNLGQEAVTVTFDLGDALAAEQGERGVVLTHDGHRAGLLARGNATLSLAGGVVTATLGQGDAVVFALEGYPRMLEHQVHVLRDLQRHFQERQERAPEGPEA